VRALAAGHLLADQRDHVAPELLGVGDEVVPPQAEDLEAEVDVVEQGGGHGLVAADERG